MLELGNYSEKLHEEIGEKVSEFNVDKLIVVGKFAEYIKQGAINKGMLESNIIIYKTIEELLENINKEVQSGDVVLIKASRAMKFEKIVENLQ